MRLSATSQLISSVGFPGRGLLFRRRDNFGQLVEAPDHADNAPRLVLCRLEQNRSQLRIEGLERIPARFCNANHFLALSLGRLGQRDQARSTERLSQLVRTLRRYASFTAIFRCVRFSF